MSFDGKTIVVTGTNSGVGAATAALLAERGARVIGLDAKGDGAGLDGFHNFDLTDPASIDAALGAIDEPLHGLANVAGVPGSFDGETVMRVNVLGLRHVTETLLPRLEPGSAVVQVASDAGAGWRQEIDLIHDLMRQRTYEAGLAWVRDHPLSGPEAYGFSKACAIVYAIAGSMLARPHGVRSLSVSPGAVETPILKDFYATMSSEILDRQMAQSGGRKRCSRGDCQSDHLCPVGGCRLAQRHRYPRRRRRRDTVLLRPARCRCRRLRDDLLRFLRQHLNPDRLRRPGRGTTRNRQACSRGRLS